MSQPITYYVNVSISGTNADPLVLVSVNDNTLIQTMTTQCVQSGYLILEFIPYVYPNNESACALVDWTQNSSWNPSTQLSQINLNLLKLRDTSFEFYQGPTLFFLLNISITCSTPTTCKDKFNPACSSNTQSSCTIVENSIDFCIQNKIIFPNVNVNILVNANNAPNHSIGGAIGLLGNPIGSGSITYSLLYTNFDGYTSGSSVLYSSTGFQYWTFPQSVPSTYKPNSRSMSTSSPSLTNIYDTLPEEQGLNLCLYDSSQNQYDVSSLSMESIPNLSNDCGMYVDNHFPLINYQIMPCGTVFNVNQPNETGGLSNSTALCILQYQLNSNCNSICLANCNVFS